MSTSDERIQMYLPSTGHTISASVESVARGKHEAVGFVYLDEADRGKVEARRAEIQKEREEMRKRLAVTRNDIKPGIRIF